MIIKKENEEILELLVFNVKQKFKQIFQDNLEGEGGDVEFSWQGNGKKLSYKDLNGEREIIF